MIGALALHCFPLGVDNITVRVLRYGQTKDNVFVTAVVSVQYQPIKAKVSRAAVPLSVRNRRRSCFLFGWD